MRRHIDGDPAANPIPLFVDESVEKGTVELCSDIGLSGKIVNIDMALSPREDFLRGMFKTWGYSEKDALAAARAAMEKLT